MRISDWSSDVCSSDLSTIAAPVYGQLGDLLGRRRLLIVALVFFMVASVLCAVSTSVEMLTAMRILQGLGGGGLMTLSQALVGEAVPPRERAHYQGYLAAVAVSSSTFGPVAGGFLTEHRSEEHTSELQSLMRNSSAVF